MPLPYDRRIKRTHNALDDTLTELLSQKKFGKITVNDICQYAQISRATFYSHFNDKYDLLRWWLTIWKPKIIPVRYNYTEFDKTINTFISDNRNIVVNLLEDANNETVELLVEFVSSMLADFIGDDKSSNSDPFDIVLYTFCAGGIISLVLWQIKNKFPLDLKTINIHSYKILDTIRRLGIDNEKARNAPGG